ncbi:hypothetical protein RHMOL_Rhmol13G0116100 [Rhododendron molle]|uniref:Uncharacterized protein n=1 Tax=Rhododendron molle TaxID=49168 RepID=A0ACC0L672_RHOML|nr:hypothetical protein RHMOL_Rhmol13G0116100 [Rhododendron molle]
MVVLVVIIGMLWKCMLKFLRCFKSNREIFRFFVCDMQDIFQRDHDYKNCNC